MDEASVTTFLFEGFKALHGGPLDDASGYVVFRVLYEHLDGMVRQFGIDLFGRFLTWVGIVATTLLTLWFLIEGFRILIGRSQRSMATFVAEMTQALVITTIATGAYLGGGSLYEWVDHDLGQMVHRVITGQAGDVFEGIDRMLGYMQMAFGFIDEIQAGDNGALLNAKDRNMGFVAVGMGGPAIVAGALLLMYKLMLALCLGFAPLFVLCLLFPRTKALFWGWLNHLVGVLFALSVLHVMAAIAVNMICAVAATFWTAKLTGASVEGVNSLAMQQGGLGLILTTLIIGAPVMAAKFFKGLLGNFNPYSAFGQGGAAHTGTAHASHSYAHARVYAGPGERQQAHVQTHAHRVPASTRTVAHEDRIKPAEDTRSFLERYPNATASLDGISNSGDALPEPLRATVFSPGRQAPSVNVRLLNIEDVEFVTTNRVKTIAGHVREEFSMQPTDFNSDKNRLAEKQAIINAMNALGERLVERGIPEEIATFNGIKHIAIETNPGLAHESTYGAKAVPSEGMIIVNTELFSEMNDFRQRDRIAHEFRHLMQVNYRMLSGDYKAQGSSPEDDADKFAREIFGDPPK